MSFFNLSTGEQATAQKEYTSEVAIEPMPEGTQANAIIEEAKFDEYEGDRYINLKWRIIGGEFNNRVVFQKVKVFDMDAKKRDKARMMLAAIDTNAGGKLMGLGREPSDMELSMCLMNVPICVTFGKWDMNGKQGNWVKSVAPAGNVSAPAAQQSKANDWDDDVAF